MNNINDALLGKSRKISSNEYALVSTIITCYILFLIILSYIKNINLTYTLFSIIFLKQGLFSYFGYRKTNEFINLVEFLACLIALIGLLILMIV